MDRECRVVNRVGPSQRFDFLTDSVVNGVGPSQRFDFLTDMLIKQPEIAPITLILTLKMQL